MNFYQGVASGTAPDLVKCSFTMMDSYISSGILEPLNTYVDSWDEWSNFTKEYVDMFTRNGSVYAVPIAVNPMLFAYNKALFAEAGLQEPPKTWDEALEMAKKSTILTIRFPAMPHLQQSGPSGSSSTMYGRPAVI